jgi:hypothetical protein
LNRNDYYYSGIGMETARTHPGARFSLESFEQGNELRYIAARQLWFRTTGLFGIRRFGNGVADGSDLPIDEVYCIRLLDTRCIPGTVSPLQVPGFHTGTQFLRVGAGMHLDTRDSLYRPTMGAAFELDFDYSHGLGHDDQSSYFRMHAALGGVLDLWRRSRILVLRATTDAVWPTNDFPVPFFELPLLGGPDALRGARWGKYRDFTTVLFTVEYRWPIWMWMDASLFVDSGGAFGRNYQGFQLNQFATGIGAGLRLRTSTAFVTRVFMAYGFNEGFNFGIAGSMDPL